MSATASDTTAHLFVVQRDQPDIFHTLAEHFSEDAEVRVIWDRRVGERRRSLAAPALERRRTDRRQLSPVRWTVQGYLFVPGRDDTSPGRPGSAATVPEA